MQQTMPRQPQPLHGVHGVRDNHRVAALVLFACAAALAVTALVALFASAPAAPTCTLRAPDGRCLTVVGCDAQGVCDLGWRACEQRQRGTATTASNAGVTAASQTWQQTVYGLMSTNPVTGAATVVSAEAAGPVQTVPIQREARGSGPAGWTPPPTALVSDGARGRIVADGAHTAIGAASLAWEQDRATAAWREGGAALLGGAPATMQVAWQ